jgi:multidrug resistance efflux pump
MAATTAVVAGTAGAVSHHQQEKYAAKDQAAYDAQVAAQQPQVVYAEAPAAAPAGSGDDLAAQIGRLADLKAQGVLSEEEFDAAKAKLISG